MLAWSTIAYGATLSAILAAVLVTIIVRPRRIAVIAAGTVAAAAGPVAWNAILRSTNGSNFFVDAPIAVFPVSWQDTGSGVFTLAVGALVLGSGPLRAAPGRRVVLAALVAAVAALVVDVYLY
jgi:uncharacterized membrane protein (UPF0182 family)